MREMQNAVDGGIVTDKRWKEFIDKKMDAGRIDQFEAIEPNAKLIELAGKLLEQNRVILNTNYMILQSLTERAVIFKLKTDEE